MFDMASGRLPGAVVISLAGLVGALVATSASAEGDTSLFLEEQAQANWAVQHVCDDGTVIEARLLVESTSDFETPETEDADPTVSVQYAGVCPEGSFNLVGNQIPATIASTGNLERVHAQGVGNVRDSLGTLHPTIFDVSWTGSGPLQTSVRITSNQGFRINTSTDQRREATATGVVTIDGEGIVKGAANHRMTPFIKTIEERNTTPPSTDG
jgi:hypothetical protein